MFFILSEGGLLVNKRDLQALYLSGIYHHRIGTRPPLQPTIYVKNCFQLFSVILDTSSECLQANFYRTASTTTTTYNIRVMYWHLYDIFILNMEACQKQTSPVNDNKFYWSLIREWYQKQRARPSCTLEIVRQIRHHLELKYTEIILQQQTWATKFTSELK